MKFNKLFCHNNAWGGAYWGARKGPSALLFLPKGPLGLLRLVMPPPPGHAAATPKALVSPCASQESPTPPMPQMLASTSTGSFLATSSWKEYLKTNLSNKCFAVFLVPSSSGCLSIATGKNSWGWPFLLLERVLSQEPPGLLTYTIQALLGQPSGGPACVYLFAFLGEIRIHAPLIARISYYIVLMLADTVLAFSDILVLSQTCWFC